MAFDKEKLRQLYIEKISGIISEIDNERMEFWLATNEQARRIWQSLEEEYAQLEVGTFDTQVKPHVDLLAVKGRLAQNNNKRRTRLIPYAAATVVFVLIGVWMVWKKDAFQSIPKETLVTVSPPISDMDRVQLTTDDGQTVILGQTRSDTIAGMELNATAHSLTVRSDTAVVMSTLRVPIKETYQVQLPDGSKVWLNAASSLQFPSRFTGQNREVYLTGEAYFEVATDKQHPFMVRTANAQLEVLGTSFNLRAYESQGVQAALVTGGVRLTAQNGESIQLQPGYAAEFDQGSGNFKKATFDPAEMLAWRAGIYYFHHASLVDLAHVIGRWYGYAVRFDRKLLAQQSVTGLMEKNNMSGFLADLESSTGIKYQIVGETLYLK